MPETKKVYLGQREKNIPPLDLIAVQRDSYRWFLEKGIAEALEEISPITDFTGKNWELSLSNHSFGLPKKTPQVAAYKGLTYDCPLRANAVLTNKKTGAVSKKQIFLGEVPLMTENGTFVINGIERCVISQIIRSPGVFFSGEIDRATGRMLYRAEVRPLRGAWLEFEVERSNAISVRINRRRKFPATTFLRAIGLSSDEEIIQTFIPWQEDGPDFIGQTLTKDSTKSKESALIEIYQKMRPGEPAVLENAEEMLRDLFFNGRRYSLGSVGRFKMNKKLGLDLANNQENWILRQEDIIATVKYLIGLRSGKGEVDDIDHLANRRIRQVGELIVESAFRSGLLRLERAIKEKMSLVATDQLVDPSQLINARPLIAAMNEFFRSNQLSAVLDQTNPLSELDNLRRLSVMGTGGITRERASFSIRDINSSQYGRICLVRTPEGPNIGLVSYMALYARINEYGFLETPYRKVEKVNFHGKSKMRVTDEIVYFSADDEQNYYIATRADIQTDDSGDIINSWVPVRYKGEFLESSVEKVEYVDLTPRQVVGVSAALIPFLDHDEAGRALMGSNMQCQAVPLINPEAPTVGTGMESVIPEAMGWVVKARNEGKVVYVDGQKIVMKLKDRKVKPIDTEGIKYKDGLETYFISKFKRTNPNGTCYSQKPLAGMGQEVAKGQIIIDGPSCQNGELSLGKNLLIAYCSLDGLEYEDAIVISDRLVKEDILTSINIEEYEASLVETKLGPEELTRDIPNVSEADLANLGEDGIIAIGSEIGPNDILVGKIAPKGETELTPEEKLLRAIFGEKAREVRDTSLRLPHGERGTVIDIKILDRDSGDELEPGTMKKVIVKVAQIRKVMVGDKLAGRHGNKGVVSRILSVADMPYLPDGTPIDIIMSPLSPLARMNLGQLLEAHLGLAERKLGNLVKVPVFEKIDETMISGELDKAGFPSDGKIVLHDGRTGEPRYYASVVGVSYIMKLVHMVEDKTHARSTGPYSLVTQQPLGGKAQMGGQRLGEMEVWALESHRAAHVLQEMLTIKSDDVVGRAKAFEAIVKGVPIPESTVPESFKVLIKELNSLSLDVEPIGTIAIENKEEESIDGVKSETEVAKAAVELATAAGSEIVGEEIKQ